MVHHVSPWFTNLKPSVVLCWMLMDADVCWMMTHHSLWDSRCLTSRQILNVKSPARSSPRLDRSSKWSHNQNLAQVRCGAKICFNHIHHTSALCWKTSMPNVFRCQRLSLFEPPFSKNSAITKTPSYSTTTTKNFIYIYDILCVIYTTIIDDIIYDMHINAVLDILATARPPGAGLQAPASSQSLPTSPPRAPPLWRCYINLIIAHVYDTQTVYTNYNYHISYIIWIVRYDVIVHIIYIIIINYIYMLI